MDPNKKVIEIYDQIAEDYAATYDKSDSPEDLVFLEKFLGYLKPKTHLVDLGCGTGFSANYFQERGLAVEGVDLSSSMIKIAKRNYPNISFSIQDMRTFEPKEPVDAVWAGYSLFHLEQKDCERLIQKIRGYLKSAGIFGLVLHEGTGEVEISDPFLPEEKIYTHLYSKDEMKTILEKYRFEIIDTVVKPPTGSKEFSYNEFLLIAK